MFKTQNFCHVASNNRNNVKAGVFIYKTNDNLQTVSASGYFNPRIIDINLHDLIIHEYIDPTDNTKVLRNVLCVTVKTLDNIETVVIKSNWEGDIEQEIADLRTYVDNTFLKLDGTSIMSGPLKMRATDSFKCAIAPCWEGVGFFKLNNDNSVTLMASMEEIDGLTPATNNKYNIGTTTKKWKNLYLAGKAYVSTINNGFDIAVPVTNSADTLALKSQVDDAANSGEQLYTTGVWFAKMYSATVVPTGAEYDGKNYADFSQVDNDNNPIVVIYEGQSGSWVEIARIIPPANHVAYLTITSKIWDIAEQTDQQGGEVLWSYNQKTFTPYPKIVSVAGLANTDLSNLSATGEARFTNKADTDLANVLANIDYVVESQLPTANNNYTWYRKYRSGWVEQGGIDTTSYVTFPVTMADTHYTVTCGMEIPSSNVGSPTVSYIDKATTGVRILLRWDGAGTTGERCWRVEGMAA